MSEDPLRIEIEDDVATVTIDHGPANMLDTVLYEALQRSVRSVADDPGVRVVVFESANENIFMAGRNINEMAGYEPTAEEAAARVDAAQVVFSTVEQLPKPTIGVIAGHAMGGGCEFALALDFRVMVEGRARIGQPEIDLGILPGGGGSQRLVRLVGRGVATEMLMLGSRLSAAEARDVGLVNRVAANPAEARSFAAELASALAAKPPLALAAAKRVIREGLDETLEEGLAVERREVIQLLLSADFVEGVAAFLEKRPPRFEGT